MLMIFPVDMSDISRNSVVASRSRPCAVSRGEACPHVGKALLLVVLNSRSSASSSASVMRRLRGDARCRRGERGTTCVSGRCAAMCWRAVWRCMVWKPQ